MKTELPDTGELLRIFIGESDKYEGKPLYEWLVRQAREKGLAGATVVRGMEGFGARSRIHTTHILRLSEDLPMVVEIVDVAPKIEKFIRHIEPAVSEGLMTVERVRIRLYRSGSQSSTPLDS